MKTGKVPQQLVVLGAVAAVVIIGFFTLRALIIPKSFGKYGHYRADAIDEIRKLPISYAGVTACADCHDDIVQKKSLGYHRNVACEVCHGPAAGHIEDPTAIKPPAPRQREGCPLCHNYNPSRPTGFPQIVTVQHNPGKPCMTCHNPHDPVPPVTPTECMACHRGIVNQKSVSHHAPLQCTTCHDVPKEHFKNPRLFLVGKPTNNAFCGKCHTTEGKPEKDIVDLAKVAPKIELAHAGRYRCWDCHYPHSPEGKR